MKKKYSIRVLSLFASILILLILNIILLINKIELSLFFEIILHYIIVDVSLLLVLQKNQYNLIKPSSIFAILYVLLICCAPITLTLSGYKLNFSISLIISLPFLLFSIGLYLPTKIRKKNNKNQIYSMINKIGPNKYDKKIVLYILIILSFVIWLIYIKGNITSILSGDFESSRITSQSGKGAYLYLIRMWIITIPLLYEYYLKNGKVPKKFYLILLVVILALLFLGGRTPIILIIANCMICKILINKMKSSKIVLYGLICLVIVGVMGFIRGAVSGETSQLFHSFQSIFNNGTYNINYITNKFPDTIDYQYGYTYLINIKMLLPGPDQDFTLWLKDALGLTFKGGGVTPTIVGEFYINYGIIGIWLGMVALGYLFSRLDYKFQTCRCKAYIIFIILQLCLSVSGGLANYIIPITLYSLVYFVISIFTSTKTEKLNKRGMIK